MNKIFDFFSEFPAESLPVKTIILHEQAFPDTVYYIEEGIVCAKLLTKHGDEVVVNILRGPSFFPLTAIVNDTPNRYFFEAKTDIVVRKAPLEKVRTWLKSDADLLWKTLSRVLVGMSGQLEEKAALMVGTSRQRLLQVLSILGQRFGSEHENRVVVTLPFTHAELASLVGISRETVTRELAFLKKDGVIVGVHSGVIELSYPLLLKELDSF